HRGRRGVCEQRSREQCEPQRECERFVVWQTSAASQRQTELCRRDGDLSLSTLRGEGHSAVREKRSADSPVRAFVPAGAVRADKVVRAPILHPPLATWPTALFGTVPRCPLSQVDAARRRLG